MATTTTPAPSPLPPAAATRAPKEGTIRGTLREAGELTEFSGSALVAVPGSVNFISEALRHAAMMMVGTLPLLFIMNMFQGASIANFAFSFLRGIGASDFFGLITGYVIPRQTATTMFGYVFAAKVCCGITAELGAMKIQQEVDAYESTGVDPRKYLVGTRLLAVLMFVPVATAVALLGNLAGSYAIVVPLLDGIAHDQMMNLHWAVQTPRDTIFALVTMGTIALTTALVACFYGLRTVGGPAAVGSSVARSLVVNLVLLHLIAAGFAVIVYGTSQNLPVGG